MKYLVIPAVLLAFALGVYSVDDSFSEKPRYLAWNYDYYQELEAQKRCLYYWYPAEEKNSTWGRSLFCLPKEYPL